MYQEFHDNSVNNDDNEKRQARKQKQNEKSSYAYLTHIQSDIGQKNYNTKNTVAVYASDACDLKTKSTSSYRV